MIKKNNQKLNCTDRSLTHKLLNFMCSTEVPWTENCYILGSTVMSISFVSKETKQKCAIFFMSFFNNFISSLFFLQWLKPNMATSAATTFKSKTCATSTGLWLYWRSSTVCLKWDNHISFLLNEPFLLCNCYTIR